MRSEPQQNLHSFDQCREWALPASKSESKLALWLTHKKNRKNQQQQQQQESNRAEPSQRGASPAMRASRGAQ
eukprot:CAMPEP_0206542852 /NCGR_PEP_ID=MMETSP0325_2-20121206/10444_1 /ASSEMBLY_ACC=CAM_ASM_000347 /TAXON_ID=2866 /ORGANISM="Crypthecodinium cohnii, Strain Seligo" /LENGTH=71 /DNA_ID=CAMNT_0054041039 /DNA_START=302 /DNA_END=514 /DNA_ORIENTATION=+